MFARSIHTLLIATILACPAMGGRCCVSGDRLEAAPAAEGCGRCTHDADADHQEPHAGHPASPAGTPPCHDCFCAGALPPGPTVLDGLEPFEACFDHAVVSPSDLGVLPSRSGSRAFLEPSPPAGRERLTYFCTLLL